MKTTELESENSTRKEEDAVMLPAMKIIPLTGEEAIITEGKQIAAIKDFWAWYASDIVSNTTRGYFAEFIVATAINVDLSRAVLNNWDDYDLKSPEGIRVEVKSASYIQSWEQKEFSKISFSIREAHSWRNKINTEGQVPSRHSDVYVFCLLKHKDQATLNPLNLEQWEFIVLPTAQVNSCFPGYKTIALNSLLKLTESVSYNRLRENILQKAVMHFIQEKK